MDGTKESSRTCDSSSKSCWHVLVSAVKPSEKEERGKGLLLMEEILHHLKSLKS